MLSSLLDIPLLEGETRPMRSLRRWRRRTLALVVLGSILLFALIVAGFVYAAWLTVQSDHRQEADEYFQRGVVHLGEADDFLHAGEREKAAGRYGLALSEFDYVHQLAPDHPGLEEKTTAARDGLELASRQSTPTPTPTLTPTATPVPIDPDALWRDAQAAYQAGQYDDAISHLRQLQMFKPEYRAADVKDLLYQALRAQGLALLDEDRLNEGLFYLEQAAAIQPLDEEAEQARALAALYVTAVSYWGVDWSQAITQFGDLYRLAPSYRDVAERLFEAHVNYGDQYAGASDWCPAQEQYAAAERVRYDAQVEEKRIAASQGCLAATPTPLPGITGTVVLTPPPIAGFTVGTLAYAAVDPTSGFNALYTFSSSTLTPLQVDVAAGQPSFRPGGGLLAYSSPAGVVGLFVVPPGGGAPQLVHEGAASYPTWSPDGTRIAYATQNESGVWEIFTIPADGSGAPQRIERGWAPVWASSGVLAFSACEDGTNVCGIFLDNPDDPDPPRRLTSDENDVPCSWSPDGQNLAYMSSHGGSWDVLVLNVSGGVAQLTSDPAIDALPAWAPDGSGLAFLSNRDGAWGIYLMRPDGSEQHKLLDLGTADPGWRTGRVAWGW
jgi:tetratricopeptide (TPR) repeat protein